MDPLTFKFCAMVAKQIAEWTRNHGKDTTAAEFKARMLDETWCPEYRAAVATAFGL